MEQTGRRNRPADLPAGHAERFAGTANRDRTLVHARQGGWQEENRVTPQIVLTYQNEQIPSADRPSIRTLRRRSQSHCTCAPMRRYAPVPRVCTPEW